VGGGVVGGGLGVLGLTPLCVPLRPFALQVVLPHKTISFAEAPHDDPKGPNPAEVHSVPSIVEHCIARARAEFNRTFSQPFSQALAIAMDPEGYVRGVRTALGTLTRDWAKVCVCGGACVDRGGAMVRW
jgi:hypothetical protein